MAIDFSLLQPVDIGGQFLAGMQAAQQRAEKLARAQKMQQDVAAWQGDMSPERTAALLMNYPEIKEQITASKAVLDEAGKRDRLGFTTKALMLSRAGQTDEVIKMAEQRIAAYRNAGKQREAKEAQDILEAYKLNPKVGEGMLTIDIAADDPKLYETMFGKSELTAYQKDLAAGGTDPFSPEGKAKSAKFADLKIDPIVQMPTPTGGQFIGRQSEYYRMFGGGESVAQPAKMPTPFTKQQYDALPPGTEYFDPRDNKVKRKGGGSGNATGNFQ